MILIQTILPYFYNGPGLLKFCETWNTKEHVAALCFHGNCLTKPEVKEAERPITIFSRNQIHDP